MISISGLQTNFKTQQFAREHEWKSCTIGEIPTIAADIHPAQLHYGFAGIWYQPVFRDDADKKHYQIILDVEATGSHGSIDANIKAGQGLYTWLTERNLDADLKIILTGQGFRFVWPYVVQPEYSKAFLEWISDPDFKDCIDAGLQKTKKIAVRLLAYRGSKRQGGNPLDIHTHVLPTASDIMTLDSAGYQRLTAGQVSAETFLHWLNDGLLPTTYAPSPWIDLFDFFQRKLRLKESIIQVNFPKLAADPVVNWNLINDALENQGILVTEKSYGDGILYMLDSCPICGKRDGHPFLTQAGRLKCYHANSCEAGKIGDDEKITGLRPDEWIDGYAGLEGDAHGRVPTAHKTVEAVRGEIVNAVNSTEDYLITATPGSGKTGTVLREILPRCREEKILYVAPTRDLDAEVFGDALNLINEAKQQGINVAWLKGRDKTNCDRVNQTRKVASSGYWPGVIVCPGCLGRKKKKDEKCAYYDQFKALEEPGLFISTHSQARYLGLDKHQFDLMIIDENPVKAFLDERSSGEASIFNLKTQVISDVASFFDKIHGVLQEKREILIKTPKNKNLHDRLYATEAPNNTIWKTCADLWEQSEITESEKDAVRSYIAAYLPLTNTSTGKTETVAQWQKRLYYEEGQIDFDALCWLLTALGWQSGTAYIKIDHRNKRNPYQFVQTSKQIPNYSNRVIVLDGTGSKPEMDSLLGRDFKVVDGNVELTGCRKIFIQQNIGKVAVTHMTEDKIEILLKKAIQYINPHTDKKILIGTHQVREEDVKTIARKLLPGCQVETIHYWKGRGINAYQDSDAFIGFGTPTVNPAGVLDTALTLFTDQEQRDQWTAQQGMNDLIQTIHRIRPVNGGKKIILMGNHWPGEIGRPDLLIDLRRSTVTVVDRIDGQNIYRWSEHSESFDMAYERIKAFVSEYRFITKEIAWCLGVGLKSESEKVRTYFDLILSNSVQKDSLFLIIYSLLEIGIQNGTSLKPEMILLGKNGWPQLINRLKIDFPEIPGLKSSSRATGGKLTDAFGSLQAVRDFYALIDRPFATESWQGEDFEKKTVVAAVTIAAIVMLARHRQRAGHCHKKQNRLNDKGNVRFVRRE